jgi:predicted DNA-binding protein (MmcQ/YjbR family)
MARAARFDPEAALEQLREIALALPEAYEELTRGEVTLRVRKKIFVFPGRGTAMTVKADADEREALLGDVRFKPAPYLARGGWVQMDLASAPIDWDEVRELIHTSYCLIAPKTLARMVQPPAG